MIDPEYGRKLAARTWGEEIDEAMAAHGESRDDIIGKATKDGTTGYGLPWDWTERKSLSDDRETNFTIWTTRRVYFPITYDSLFWVESVPREPCDEAASAFGAG